MVTDRTRTNLKAASKVFIGNIDHDINREWLSDRCQRKITSEVQKSEEQDEQATFLGPPDPRTSLHATSTFEDM
jgi:hypothetical protein